MKRCISAHFHSKHMEFFNKQRQLRDELREQAFLSRGMNPNDAKPNKIPLANRYDYDPHTPIHLQPVHPIFKILDRQAGREDRYYRKNDQFIPKPWMAPNVFLPAYLEVSYRSCTGCFVRKPHIKKDGLMEIPSPYPVDIHERAGMYYTRFGRRADRRQSGFSGYELFWTKRKVKT